MKKCEGPISPDMSKVPLEIIKMAAEFSSPYNDGYTKEWFRRQLEAIRDYIDRLLEE